MRLLLGLTITAGLLSATPSHALFPTEVRCAQVVAKASTRYVETRANVLQKCEDAKATGTLSPSTVCTTESATEARLAKAADKLKADIGKACGGPDNVCGGGDDLSTTTYGFPATCPDFNGGSCSMSTDSCQDVAECLECIANGAVDQAIGLYYGALALPSTSGTPLNKCQRTLGKSATKYLGTKAKVLNKCWNARFEWQHANTCPNPGDGKAVGAISKAAAKYAVAVCKACGGPDAFCTGSDGFTPAQIGFVADCPDVQGPNGLPCGLITSITTLPALAECVDCVTSFASGCSDAASVPGLITYPLECQ